MLVYPTKLMHHATLALSHCTTFKQCGQLFSTSRWDEMLSASSKTECRGNDYAVMENGIETSCVAPSESTRHFATTTQNNRPSPSRAARHRRFSERKKIIVKLNGDDDSIDPRNWSLLKRARTIGILCMLVFTQAWAGACDSLNNSKASKQYHVSPVAEDLSTAMYLFGIGSGCLFVGPLSQTLGRNPVYLGFTLAYLFFILGTALSKDYASQVVCRYLAGLASSAALGINGASVGDLFRPVERALWFPVIAWVNVVRQCVLSYILVRY